MLFPGQAQASICLMRTGMARPISVNYCPVMRGRYIELIGGSPALIPYKFTGVSR
jgi:hypothetical protein